MSATDLSGPAGGIPSRPSRFMGYVGGAVSLSLICMGVAWGAQVVLRDVSEIPVVRAAHLEQRVAPDAPGGDIAENAGLAVNAVAAAGQVAEVPEVIRLAPEDVGPTADDLTPVITETAPEPDPAPVVAEAPAPLTEEDATTRALAEALGQPLPIPATPASLTVAAAPRVALGQRPRARPATLQRVVAVPAQPAAPAATPAEPRNDGGFTVMAADALPSGTPLAQVGAFASPELAVQEWDRLSAIYSDYFGTRSRVIQRAVTGGRTFYRLRVRGFADIDDTRRFCSAIKAGGRSDCIALTTR